MTILRDDLEVVKKNILLDGNNNIKKEKLIEQQMSRKKVINQFMNKALDCLEVHTTINIHHDRLSLNETL